MLTVTAAQMRQIDRRCIEGVGIPGAVLMNNAGMAVSAEIRGGPVVVVCGKGNNGGDGFVVARLAHCAGLKTSVVLLAAPEELEGDAAIFLRAYQRLQGTLIEAREPAAVRQALEDLKDAQVWVDAMLGTGAKGAVREPIATAIECWPKAWTIAVDLPSGLNADTGTAASPCIRADLTVTFHAAKKGFTAPGAAAFLGKVLVADIGIPEECADDAAWAKLGLEKA